MLPRGGSACQLSRSIATACSQSLSPSLLVASPSCNEGLSAQKLLSCSPLLTGTKDFGEFVYGIEPVHQYV